MRIIEGIANPLVVVSGWIFAVIAIGFLITKKSQFSNFELSNLAALGAFVFILQSFVILPIPSVFPIFYGISGIILIVTITGPSRGILIGAIAMTLNHIFIPGSLSMLGTNLTNMIIAASLIGWLPSQIYNNPNTGRRIRYLGSFLGGFLYVLIEGMIIFFELGFSLKTESNIVAIALGFLVLVVFLGILEGLFTALATSYYHRTFFIKQANNNEDNVMLEETEIEKIDFDLEFIENSMETS